MTVLRFSNIVVAMKKIFIILGCCLIMLAGCAPIKTIKTVMKPITSVINIGPQALFPPYSGHKAKITVTGLDTKVVNVNPQVSQTLRSTLIKMLIDTDRFLIIERQAQAADLIINAQVTKFDPLVSGGKDGVGGGGTAASGALGGLLGYDAGKAHIALEIKIIDASTSNVLSMKSVQGQAQAVNIEPMEKAISSCMLEAARYISEAVPAAYYKYKHG